MDGDTAAAVEFLHRWAPEGPWWLTAIVPDGTTETVTFTATGGAGVMTRWIDARQGRKNLYFSVNRPGRLLTKKASKADIAAATALHVDADVREGEDRDDVLRRLLAYRPEPSVVVFSGGGYQGFWLLAAPIVGENDEVEARNRRIANALGADHCFNIDRVMRLPGTVNLPTAKKRAAGREAALAVVVRACWELRCTLDDFEAEYPPKTVEAPVASVVARRRLPAWCEDLVRIGDAAEYGGDRSRAVFAAAAEMVRCGRTDAEIGSVLADAGNGISAHIRERGKRDPAGYARRQAERARDAVRNEATDEGEEIDPRGGEGYEDTFPASEQAMISIKKIDINVKNEAESIEKIVPVVPMVRRSVFLTPEARRRSVFVDGVDGAMRAPAAARMARYLVERRIDPVIALGILRLWNDARLRPPLEDSVLVETVEKLCLRAEAHR